MQTSTKVVLGIAGVTGLGAAIVFWPKKAHAGQQGPGPGGGTAPVTKDSDADLIKACVDGTSVGGKDGAKDGASSGSKKPLPISNYSDKKIVQAKFEECYMGAYTKMFDAAKAVADAKKSMPFSTGPTDAEKSTAYAAGKDAGSAQAKLDSVYQIDYTRVPDGYRSEPSDLVLRDRWRAGYNEGYASVWATPGYAPMGSGSDSGTEEDDSGVFGEYVRVAGRLIPRARTSQTSAGKRFAQMQKRVEAARQPAAHSGRATRERGPVHERPARASLQDHALRAVEYAYKPIAAPFKFIGGMVHGVVTGAWR